MDEIQTTHKGLHIEADIGYICNYNCSYCTVHHLGGWIDHLNFIKFIDKTKPVSITLCGGEPTYHPMITDILTHLESIHLSMATNLSRDMDWWKIYYKYIDQLATSYHLEHTKYDEFFKKLSFLCQHRIITVSMVAIDNTLQKYLDIIDGLSSLDNVYCIIKPCIKNRKIIHYDEKYLKYIGKMFRPKRTTISDETLKLFKVTDGKRIRFRQQNMIASGETNFKGWECRKGLDLLKIRPNGNVYKAICEMDDEPIGNISEDIILPSRPSICEKDRCICGTDIRYLNKRRDI